MRYLLFFILLASSSLSGCFVHYRQDIEQGNVMTTEMVSQVHAGMTRQQVRFILGTPLIKDVFHQDRWDYYYSFLAKGKKVTRLTRVTIVFRDDKVSRIISGAVLNQKKKGELSDSD